MALDVLGVHLPTINQYNMDGPFYFGLSSYRQCVTQFLVLCFDVDFGIDSPYFESSDGMGDSPSKRCVSNDMCSEKDAMAKRRHEDKWRTLGQ